MITFSQIEKLFAYDTQKKYCLEILFSLAGSGKFDCCWMGKLYCPDEKRDVYWFGLTPDGSYGFGYPTFREMADAPVFDGSSLRQLWENISVQEINGMEPEEQITVYLHST